MRGNDAALCVRAAVIDPGLSNNMDGSVSSTSSTGVRVRVCDSIQYPGVFISATSSFVLLYSSLRSPRCTIVPFCLAHAHRVSLIWRFRVAALRIYIMEAASQ